MKKLLIALVACAAIASVQAGTATAGATVTLNGTFFTNPGGWSTGANAAPADLVDGVYQPETHQWDFDSVWWNGVDQPSNNIVLDLAGTFVITDFKVQADDNDTYKLEYFGTDLAWHDAWDVPAIASFGLVTRDLTLGSTIEASALRFTATGGDGYYAVSEIEANGRKVSSVPETGTSLALLMGGLGLVAGLRRRFAV